jgi:Cu/Ag efflux protein CusF
MVKVFFLATLLTFPFTGCGPDRAPVKPVAPTSVADSQSPKNGEYPAKGKITKINPTLGSVELDHDDIPGLMPAMRMEFYLADKAMLSGLAVDDFVDFTLLYKDGTETITKISPR